MDPLTVLEPQLAIPVIIVVLGALLVYLFGFKQTEEPSLEHLAVLHQSSKGRSIQQQKSVSSSVKGGRDNAAQSKPKANGTVSNGVAAAGKKVTGSNGVVNNKENKPPQQQQQQQPKVVQQQQVKKEKQNLRDPANKPEDFETGEWIPAVSRKDKSKKNKEAPSSPKKGANKSSTPEPPVGSNAAALIASGNEDSVPSVLAAAASGTGKAPRIEDLLAEMNVLKDSEKQNKSPKSGGEQKQNNVKEVSNKKKEKETNASEEVQQVAPPAAVEEVTPAKDFKSNIAFDEMGGGDSWEEAKSRGAKKRRARRD